MATKKSAPKKKGIKAPVVAKPQAASATDKQAELQKQIEALQAQMQELNKGAVLELKQKIAAARKVVQDLEGELEKMTGKRVGVAKAPRTRRPAITDEALQTPILAAMNKHGKEGLNAKQLAELVGQDALTIRKFIAANGKVLKRVGLGPGTKFFLP